MDAVIVPDDLDEVLDRAWRAAEFVPGFLLEAEARLLGTIAACAPGSGAILEIGSFKGKSTVMMALVCRHYGLAPVVAIDPHNLNNPQFDALREAEGGSTYESFLRNISQAGLSEYVDVRRAYSTDVAPLWSGPIRLLWIDGDHSYAGAKADFEGFMPHLIPGGIVALHDATHEFLGPIRVFVEEMLSSDKFGPAGFVRSIAWAQYRPADGGRFAESRVRLRRRAERIIPYLSDETRLAGFGKLLYKLQCSRIPRGPIAPEECVRRIAL